MKLVFLVNDQSLKRVDKNILVSDSVDFVHAQFVFTYVSWTKVDDGRLRAIFWYNEKTEYVDLDNCFTCKVPDECLKCDSFQVSLMAEYGGAVVPTEKINIDIKPSGFDKPSRPDAYSKIIERLNQIEKDIKELNRKIPFSFAISDETGQYGYIINDKFIPF